MRIRTVCAVALTFALLLAKAPPAAAQDRKEFWPEANLWYTVNRRTRLLFVASSVRDREGDKTEGEASLYLDYRENRHTSLRIGYSYLPTPTVPKEANRTVERRITADFVALFWLSRDWTIYDRNRVDFRFLGSDSPALRYRNRLRVEGLGRLGRERIAPFASIEAFVNEGGGGVNRWRAETGLDIPVSRQFVPGLYVGWQTDARPRRNEIFGFGVVLQVILK